jgi:hypothetical protein
MDRDGQRYAQRYYDQLSDGEPYGTDDLYSHRNGCQWLCKHRHDNGKHCGVERRYDQRSAGRVCGGYAYHDYLYYSSEWGIRKQWQLYIQLAVFG